MTIKFNNEYIILPSELMKVSEFLKWKEIPAEGTAIAINGRLLNHSKWDITVLNENDDVVIISAAFGG